MKIFSVLRKTCSEGSTVVRPLGRKYLVICLSAYYKF